MGKRTEIRYANDGDKEFWLSLDKHLSAAEFNKKVRNKQCYIILVNGTPAGLLRYNLFWDNTPFCTLLYIHEDYRGCGYGRALTEYWQTEMHSLGYGWLLTSTRSDEDAQHFYRKLGYKDCGSLSAPDQPPELFLSKFL